MGNPAAFVDDTCAPGRHAAVWTANPIVWQQNRVAIRVFADPTNSEHASYGAYRLTLCDIPFLAFHLRGAFTGPTATGVYTWRAFVTPLDSTGSPFPDSTYELRAIVPVPHVLHVRTSYLVRSRTLVVSGRVTAAGGPDAGADVEIFQTDDVRQPLYFDGVTGADGTFRFTKRVGQASGAKTISFDASTWKDEPCTSPSPFRYCRQRTSPATLSFTATIPRR